LMFHYEYLQHMKAQSLATYSIFLTVKLLGLFGLTVQYHDNQQLAQWCQDYSYHRKLLTIQAYHNYLLILFQITSTTLPIQVLVVLQQATYLAWYYFD
jgi:hypothetical protein